MYFTTWGIEPIFCHNYKWSATLKKYKQKIFLKEKNKQMLKLVPFHSVGQQIDLD